MISIPIDLASDEVMELRIMINTQQVLIIAGIAGADPRTVRRYFSGGVTRPSVVTRIERALGELGIAPRTVEPSASRSSY